jgi:hypothetical protein
MTVDRITAPPELEPLQQELVRLLQSEPVRCYLRQTAGPARGEPRPAAPPELGAARAITEQLQRMIRDMSGEALQALTVGRGGPSRAGSH